MAFKRKEQCVELTFQPVDVIKSKLSEGWLVHSMISIDKKYASEQAILIVFERDVIEIE